MVPGHNERPEGNLPGVFFCPARLLAGLFYALNKTRQRQPLAGFCVWREVMQNQGHSTAERYGWSVNDWAAAAGISRASVYELLPNLETVKFGGKRLILTHPKDWLQSLKGAA